MQGSEAISHYNVEKDMVGFNGIFRGLPFHVGYFYQHSLKPMIHRDLSATGADLTYCQLVRMIPYIKGFNGVIWLDFMDSFSRNLYNRLEKSGWWQRYGSAGN